MKFKNFGEISKEKIKWLEQKYSVTFTERLQAIFVGE